MKYFSYIFFLFPVLFFLILILINKNLLSISDEINFFWLFKVEIPIIAYFSIFFGLYVIITWFLIKFSSFFTGLKSKKDKEEIYKLKSQLLDGQSELIEKIKEEFLNNLDEYKKTNLDNINILKKENEKVVSNLDFEIKNIKEKLNNLSK